MPNIIFYVFAGVVIAQLIYYFAYYGRFAFAKPQEITAKKLPVSVIVCAKNEADNIKKLIPLLARQNYPDFEIILIDDASTDETTDIAEAFENEYSNVKLVKVENNEAFWGNKKYALTLGIKAASKDYLLFTDADCYTATDSWITAMSSAFTLKKTIVLGYAAFEKKKNSILNKLIRFDAILRAAGYFSRSIGSKPHTGNGRNLAYKKEEFFKANGYVSHMNLYSGEDALFINQAATASNTGLCYHPDGFTYCPPKNTYKAWFAQKRRQAYTATFFKPADKAVAKIQFTFQLLFFVLAITLVILQYNWMLLVPAIILRYIAGYFAVGYTAAKLKEKDVAWWYPVLEILLIFTLINVSVTNMFTKPAHWK